MQDLPLRLIGKADIIKPDQSLCICNLLFFLLRFLRELQKPEYFPARRHPIHRNVKKTAKLPHREKEIRRQKDDEQTSAKPGMTATVLQQCRGDAKCCSAVCDNVHNRDRI